MKNVRVKSYDAVFISTLQYFTYLTN